MDENRKVLGYMFGLPIYETKDQALNENLEINLKTWDQFHREKVAGRIAEQIVKESPPQGM